MILFSAKVSEKHQVRLVEEFPEQEIIFCQSKDEVNKHLGEADIYVTYGGDVTVELLNAAPKLKWIANLSAGVDGYPFVQLEKRDIFLTNVRGIHKTQMAEYAIAMLLQVYRNTKTIIENERQAKWDNRVRVKEITGKTIVILGTGAIGGETARLAQAFRMKTIGISRSGKAADYFDEVYQTRDLIDVLPKADLIVSILPSTKGTRQLLTYEHFTAMKESAVFLNMGRGDVLIEDDLLRAIQEGALQHAVLDVFEEEPLPKEHPFWQEENITVTPHISGLSPEYVKRALDIFKTNLTVYEKNGDNYINIVDLKLGY